MRFDVLTLFPALFDSYLQQSLLNKAIASGLVEVHRHDFRDWTTDKHRSVDDRPFGGGPGMVIKVEPVVQCVEHVRTLADDPGHLVLLTPQGETLGQPLVERLAEHRRLILLCGRYEGFDQRVIDILRPQEISIGDYILNGGEVAAMVTIDAVVRLVPGVLGDQESHVDDSFSRGNRRLECAQYTRPREFRGLSVPEVLLSGDHEQVARWRREQSYLRTRQRRPDLLDEPADTTDHTN
ncbi:MAG: tRNA (guanosine(37)-N1)-methyltransferase TrmD [Planctomycetales bacterium]|nr:tRNA (guanosine(37)-N1)-methyltransferase TrmD [Planctomycetales bacterium]